MTTWKRHEGGVGWLYLGDGRCVVERPSYEVLEGYMDRFVVEDSEGAWRTRGTPSTMTDLIERYHDIVGRECEVRGLDAATVYALIGVESVSSREQRTRDIFSIRYEPPFEGFDADDADRWFSAGLLQTRLLESRAAAKREGWEFFDVHGEPRELEPADIMIPSTAIAIGCSHLEWLMRRWSDPMHLNVAWNTGGVRKGRGEFRLHCHGGDDRVAKFTAWRNDAVHVLNSRGIS